MNSRLHSIVAFNDYAMRAITSGSFTSAESVAEITRSPWVMPFLVAEIDQILVDAESIATTLDECVPLCLTRRVLTIVPL